MKKSIIVLLMAVLVAGLAFAGTLTGSAGISFDVNLQPDASGARTWSLVNNSEWKYSFAFNYDTTKVEVMGEPEVWAELAITGSANIKFTNMTGTSGTTPTYNKYAVSLKKANIHIGQDITIGLLNEGVGSDFAAYYRLDSYGAPLWNIIADDHETANISGFTVAYKDWAGGFGAKGTWATDPAEYTFYGNLLTPEFAIVDGLKIQGAGYGAFTNTGDVFARGNFAGASAAITYESDKLPASFGADVMYDAGILYEARGNVSYVINEDLSVKADVYAVSGSEMGYTGDDEALPALYAMASTAYGMEIKEGTTLDLTAAVEIQDALIDDRELVIEATEDFVMDSLTVALTETYYVLNAKTLAITADVEYAAEKFTAYAGLYPTMQFADSDAELFTSIGFECGVYTTAIIDQAELGISYSDADFAKSGDTIVNAGLISAYVSIAF